MRFSTVLWSSALMATALLGSTTQGDNYLTPAHEELILKGGEKFEYQVGLALQPWT